MNTAPDINIPDEALEAAAKEIAPHPWSMYTDAAQDHFRGKSRAACLAMLRAWPKMKHMPAVKLDQLMCPPLIILPLPAGDANA